MSKGKTPCRQLGRIKDPTWDMLKAAAAAKGKTFTDWAVRHLVRQAERELRSREGK